MKIFVLITVGLYAQFISIYGCFTRNEQTITIDIPERFVKGQILSALPIQDAVHIEPDLVTQLPSFVEVNNTDLISTADVTLDIDQALCKESERWGFVLVCNNTDKRLYVNLDVNYTDDYDPVLKSGLSFKVQELAPNNTIVEKLGEINDFFTDQDCRQENTRGTYAIQAGNTDVAFGMSGKGDITVNRLISYQKGETMFNLTISVHTHLGSNLDGRSGSTSVAVIIEDIDDNDPAFNYPEYRMHVEEENFTAINVEHLTSPPVFAFDQDTGINDTITYSINGTIDTVDIHNMTGVVRVTRVLDREAEPSVRVKIKANQVNNSWRSAVATLLVIVDDINDNRPKFLPSNPTQVTIPEHSAVGVSVVRILALDNDTDENALFNYTIESRENILTVQTDILGNLMYGTVIVANSSALDREERSSLNITVGTKEYTPPQGGDCSTGMCNITITIQLTDINDNSPVFDNSSYVFTVKDNQISAFVGQISARDADEGENARLTYECMSSPVLGSDACDFVTVNDTTGKVNLQKTLFSSQMYYALVKACDSPTDLSQVRCTTVPIRISLPPDFQLNVSSFNFTVYENLPAGTFVGDILNYNVHFVLLHNKFKLNERNLLTQVSLDREEQGWYMLDINSNNQNNTNISVLVTVLDVNDNSPAFSPHNGSVTLNGNETTGHVITVVSASDDDEGINAKISYSLQPESMLQYFDINDSGAITLRALPTMETMDLLVKASDEGLPSLSGFYTLRIIIPAVNGSVVIFAPLTFDKIYVQKEDIERELRKILGVGVAIEAIRQHSADSSAIYITAQDTNTGHSLTSEELQKLVDKNPAKIAALFRENSPGGTNEKTTAADDFTTPVIVLIVIGAVLLIALIIAMVIIARGHKSRKRHKRLMNSLSTPATIYNTTDEEKDTVAIIDDTDDDQNHEGATNPVFADDLESQNVTLVNETEVTSVAEPQSCHEDVDNDNDAYENEATEHSPDADSGVPSDRENGQGDDDGIDNSFDDGGSSPHNSRYLAAVLDEPLLSSADPGHDAIDVTSPPDARDAFPLQDEGVESAPLVEPPVDFEVQESSLAFPDEEGPQGEARLNDTIGSDLDPAAAPPEDKVADSASLDDFPNFWVPTRSFTPPMVRKSQEQREEELEPMPEEPLPDYGKRVRFNFQVTEHEMTDYNDNDEEGDDGEGQADEEGEFPPPPPPLPPPIPPPPPPPPPTSSAGTKLTDDSGNDTGRGDENDAGTNEEEEITSF